MFQTLFEAILNVAYLKPINHQRYHLIAAVIGINMCMGCGALSGAVSGTSQHY
jgi:hypothetical protein